MIPCATLPARLLDPPSSPSSHPPCLREIETSFVRGFTLLLFSSLLFSSLFFDFRGKDFDERQKHFDVEVESAQRIRVSFSSLQ